MHYFPNDGENKGTCIEFGDDEQIKQNSTITDYSEDDLKPYHLEVGENFGCIHYEHKSY